MNAVCGSFLGALDHYKFSTGLKAAREKMIFTKNHRKPHCLPNFNFKPNFRLKETVFVFLIAFTIFLFSFIMPTVIHRKNRD